MGWREEKWRVTRERRFGRDYVHLERWLNNPPHWQIVAIVPSGDMPAPDRIAMARELLGTSEGVDAALATVRKAAAVYRKQPFGTDECALAWEQFNLALGALMSECMAFAKDPAP